MTYDVRCYPDTRGQQQVANKHASWLRPGRKQRSYVWTPIHTFVRITGLNHLQRATPGTDWAIGWMFQDSIPNRDKGVSLFSNVQNALEAHLASYSACIVFFPRDKAPGA